MILKTRRIVMGIPSNLNEIHPNKESVIAALTAKVKKVLNVKELSNEETEAIKAVADTVKFPRKKNTTVAAIADTSIVDTDVAMAETSNT